MSAAERLPPGCPEPAAASISMTSRRMFRARRAISATSKFPGFIVLHVTELALLLEQDVFGAGKLGRNPGQGRTSRRLPLRSSSVALGWRFFGRTAAKQPAPSRLVCRRFFLWFSLAATQQAAPARALALGSVTGRRAARWRLRLRAQSELAALSTARVGRR